MTFMCMFENCTHIHTAHSIFLIIVIQLCLQAMLTFPFLGLTCKMSVSSLKQYHLQNDKLTRLKD